MSEASNKEIQHWAPGLLLGLGIGIAVGMALDNIAVGIGVGAGLGFGFYLRSGWGEARPPLRMIRLRFSEGGQRHYSNSRMRPPSYTHRSKSVSKLQLHIDSAIN